MAMPFFCFSIYGERGIRTLGCFHNIRFQVERMRPSKIKRLSLYTKSDKYQTILQQLPTRATQENKEPIFSGADSPRH